MATDNRERAARARRRTSWSALREAKEELFNLRFQMATGQMDNNRRLRTVRQDIARIYTVMRAAFLTCSSKA